MQTLVAAPETAPLSTLDAPVSSSLGTVLVVGATSSIARAVAAELAQRGFDLCLAGRDLEETSRIAKDLTVRYGIRADHAAFEAAATGGHSSLLSEVVTSAPAGLAGMVVACGMLGEQPRAARDVAHAEAILTANFTGVVSILTLAANYLESRGRGFIIALSSVAGDRGRQSNYVYGAAKGGLTIFLQGLRNRLAPAGVRVLTIKLGFVDTRMTFGMPGLFLVASPAQAARGVLRALDRSRDVAYVPGFWRLIMLIIRCIPEAVFKRLKL